eukprot:gene6937-7716_t
MDNTQDYSKWQRQSRVVGGLNEKNVAPTIGSRPTPVRTSQTTRVLSAACSSLCRHWPSTKCSEVKKVAQGRGSLDTMQVLQFQIKAKRSCIMECRKQVVNLIQENFKLKQEIEGSNKHAHVDVNDQLQKYHKYRNAMQTIDTEHGKQKVEVELDFQRVKRCVDKMMDDLEKKLADIDEALQRKQKELKTLNNYKDKEYPEKILKIGRLKNELEYLKDEQSIDVSEIERVIDIENARYKMTGAAQQSKLLEEIRSDAFDSLDRTVKEKATQNIRFKKEIEIHRIEKARLEKENKQLELKIETLINKDRPSMQKELYPGIFRMNEICTPDREIVLDIPKKEFMPL